MRSLKSTCLYISMRLSFCCNHVQVLCIFFLSIVSMLFLCVMQVLSARDVTLYMASRTGSRCTGDWIRTHSALEMQTQQHELTLWEFKMSTMLGYYELSDTMLTVNVEQVQIWIQITWLSVHLWVQWMIVIEICSHILRDQNVLCNLKWRYIFKWGLTSATNQNEYN